MSDAIAAVATGAQVAAIGVVRLSGDGVLIVAHWLSPRCYDTASPRFAQSRPPLRRLKLK